MSAYDPLSTAFLLVETTKTGEPVWAVKWRSADGERVRRRLGVHAWVVHDPSRGWRPRSGRPGPGQLTEYQARRRVVDFVEVVEAERATSRVQEAEEAAREAAVGGPTFRTLAHTWLEHVEFVLDAKPATLRDYRSMLAEPGTPHRRGRGVTIGRMMAALGDVPVADVTTAQIEALLMAHAREGVGARSVDKHRQVLSAIFNFGLRPEQAERWQLTSNPAAAAAKRREPAAARLEVFTVEQIEALARAAASGAWRGPHDDLTDAGALFRAEEDAQFAELLRVAAYTGLRRGELVALRWRDVRWSERVLVVERALSGDVEGTTKSGRSATSHSAIKRSARSTTSRVAGTSQAPTTTSSRLSPATGPTASALRRRFIAARDAAGLPALRFHDLRHTAGTLLTRVLDPVTVRDVLGHADLKTTERYLHAVRASRLSDAATRAFTPDKDTSREAAARATLRAAAEQLGWDEARRVLESVG
jgi:integrase